MLGSKVMQGSTGVNQGQPGVKMLRNALWLPNLVGRTQVLCNAGVEGHVGQMGGSTGDQIAQKCPIATIGGFKADDATGAPVD